MNIINAIETDASEVVHAVEAQGEQIGEQVQIDLTEVFTNMAVEVVKLRAELDALVARIEGHNNSGTPFPIK